MANNEQIEFKYESVNAAPVKSFFVSMLTRDIELDDAILDLLDNCVDGVLRSEPDLSKEKPYEGFQAEINFDKKSFSIVDNCGGIPWKLHGYAFRMGRPDDRLDATLGTVGVYGIGMKRAMFKMGARCTISTQNKKHNYKVEITPEWISDENQNAWSLPVKAVNKKREKDGTEISISDLYPGISSRFGADSEIFTSNLMTTISTHYAFIINKGFKISINGKNVVPKPTKLFFSSTSKQSIQPFIFETIIDGVDVFLTVGFTRPIPTQDEISDEQKEKQRSSLDAGWTVICNDRAVLYSDRSALTGWGEAGVPSYHTQFIAIAGIVEFRSSDPSKLPTTTTKRGIDASSPIYLKVKNKMREGMLMFTTYTNKWKGQAIETRKHMGDGKSLSLMEIKKETSELKFTTLSKSYPSGSKQYRPDLPTPKRLEGSQRKISFNKDKKDVEIVSESLFGKINVDASVVAEECFDLVLRDAR